MRSAGPAISELGKSLWNLQPSFIKDDAPRDSDDEEGSGSEGAGQESDVQSEEYGSEGDQKED